MLVEDKMESFAVATLCLLLVCWICCCVSDKASDSEPNLYLQRALSEFESRYETLRTELKSEIENRKVSEEKLADEMNKLEHNCKATEAKLMDEINELKLLRLQDIGEVATLKSELELTKKEVGTLKLKMDKYETKTTKFDNTIKQFYSEKVPELQSESESIDEHTAELSNRDLLQQERDDTFPNIGTEPVRGNVAFQRLFNPNKPGDRANMQYHNDKRRKTKVNNRRQLNNSNVTHVAFFARLSTHTPKLQPGQDIVFNDVLTNIGSGYHNLHGNFVTPIAGVYVFHVNVLSNAGHCHARLMKNGQVLAMLDNEQTYDRASTMAIIELDAGDDIAVQNADYPDRVFFGLYYSTFSGFLLYAYPAPEIIGK